MKRTQVLKFVLPLIVLLAAGTARAQQMLLTDDTQIISSSPTTNYGTGTAVNVNTITSSLLKFDLVDILPANTTGAQVSRARLILFAGGVTTPGTFNVLQVNSAWAEGTVTYATRPTVSVTPAGTASAVSGGDFIFVNVTALVQNWLNHPTSNFGMEITPVGSTSFSINSKESQTYSHQAILQIDLVGGGATGPQGPQGPQGPAGPTGPQGPPGSGGSLMLPFTGSAESFSNEGVFTITSTEGQGDAFEGFGSSGDSDFSRGGAGFQGTGGDSGTCTDCTAGAGMVGNGGVGDTGGNGSPHDGGVGVSGSGGQPGNGGHIGAGLSGFGDPGIIATVQSNGHGVAGAFNGNVTVSGSVSKASGSFKIDDPIDPENKYLYHSFVESPDMMNVYNGTVTTDGTGYAEITMPAYFQALNRDYRYQLTVVGAQFAQAIVSSEMVANHFTIRTDKPGVKVSWQVTGIRQDAWANAHRIQEEVEKDPTEKGHYMHPELFGHPGDLSIQELAYPDALPPARAKLAKQEAAQQR